MPTCGLLTKPQDVANDLHFIFLSLMFPSFYYTLLVMYHLSKTSLEETSFERFEVSVS